MGLLIHNATILDARGLVYGPWLRVSDTVITAIGDGNTWARGEGDRVVDAHGQRLVPGFIDLHVYGGGGHSFQDGGVSIRKALAFHRAHGTPPFPHRLVTAPLEDLER